MQEAELELRDQFKDLVRAKKYNEVEELWLNVTANENISLDFHQTIIRYMVNKGEFTRLEEYYSSLLGERIGAGHHQQALDIAGLLLDFDPNLGFLRDHLMSAIKGLHSDRDEDRLAEFLRISGLDGEAANLKEAMARLDDLLGASKGQVFRHNQWGLGVVKELDPHAGFAFLDFPKKKHHKMTIEGIKNYLRRVPRDHVLARIALEPEAYKEAIFEDPAAAIRLALKNEKGKMKSAEIKKLFLTDKFLSDAEYKRWWTKAKKEIRLDPHIDQSGSGANIMLILRAEPRSFVDEIFQRFLEAKSLVERRNTLRDVARHGDSADMSPEDITALYQLFSKPIADEALKTDLELFGHGLLFEEFAYLFSDDANNPIQIEDYIKNQELDLGTLIGEVGIYELQRIALEFVMKHREEREEHIFSEVFFYADSKLVSWMEKALGSKEKGVVMENALERVMSNPDRNPDIFLWAGKKVIDGQLPHVAESFPPFEILLSSLNLTNDLESQLAMATTVEAKSIEARIGRIRTFLQEGQNKNVKAAVRAASADDARRLLGRIGMINGISNQLRMAIEGTIQYEHPELTKAGKAEEEEKQNFHYASEEIIEKKRSELSHIVQVEIPELAKRIGAAAELGDLKENAEYHAAKDRQKLFAQQAEELRELLERARVIKLQDVKPEEVRFGTRTQLRNKDSNEVETYSVMGMWEADMEQNIISYLTPFGSQILGRKPGEDFTVTLPDGRTVDYQVESIARVVDS